MKGLSLPEIEEPEEPQPNKDGTPVTPTITVKTQTPETGNMEQAGYDTYVVRKKRNS
jgi:hypothetical protein